MVESLLNYTASFAISGDEARLKSSETYVPFSAVQNWFTNFERRLQQNPTFWKHWMLFEIYYVIVLEPVFTEYTYVVYC